MSKHTSEPWAIWNSGDGIIAAEEKSFSRGGIALITCNSQVDGRAAKANARRIVACVNACAGLPTKQLEVSPIGGVLNGVAGLIAQRDQLLEVLEMVIADKAPGYHDCIDDGEQECAWCVARSAIAKAKGGAA